MERITNCIHNMHSTWRIDVVNMSTHQRKHQDIQRIDRGRFHLRHPLSADPNTRCNPQGPSEIACCPAGHPLYDKKDENSQS